MVRSFREAVWLPPGRRLQQAHGQVETLAKRADYVDFGMRINELAWRMATASFDVGWAIPVAVTVRACGASSVNGGACGPSC